LRKHTLREALRGSLTPGEIARLYSGFDVVGDIAVLRVHENLWTKRELIGETVLKLHGHVRTVLCQTGPVSGLYRLRRLEWVAGEKRSATVHREHGCLFKLDLAKTYFSPRLQHERARVAELIKPGETVLNMFAGVGCFSIIIAKHSQASKVYSIDVNPEALKYMEENVWLNRVHGKVVPILGDAAKVIEKSLAGASNRVLMPLPELAYQYLESAVVGLNSAGGWIHYYDFVHAGKDEDPGEKVASRAAGKLGSFVAGFQIPVKRVVRNVGPNWYQVVLDIQVTKD